MPTGRDAESTASQFERGLISVLMTVRNGQAFVGEAIESLLAQTDDRFEVIAVDDGSTDQTWEVLCRYTDSRLCAHRLPPVGRVPALLHAVKLARGEFYAFLDADDLALPNRLAMQRAYLAEHAEVALVGSRIVQFDGTSERLIRAPTGPEAVRFALGMYNPVAFSSVMCRRQAYDAVGGFRTEDGWTYDLLFLIRMATLYPIDILPMALIRYRRHPRQVSASAEWEKHQRPKSARVKLWAAKELGLPLHLWIFPLLGWLYAYVPARLRPHRLKNAGKKLLLKVLNAS